ncbi:MAG: hypothetical protein OXE57_19315, partial [Alphaproteobacteria bacterium]|nr:hypothetical protein [Alphaproteobacteria bacterium]
MGALRNRARADALPLADAVLSRNGNVGTGYRVTGGERVEDRALLRGRGRFIDDLPVPARTLHAAILRSPHAHARLGRITAPEGVRLFTGQEIAAGLKPFIAALRTPMRHFPVATDKV